MSTYGRRRTTRRWTPAVRVAVLGTALALLASGCGARLDDDQRALALRGGGGGGGTLVGDGAVDPLGGTVADDGTGAAAGTGGGGPAGSGTAGARGGSAGTAGTQGGGANSGPGGVDTRKAPPGGNGGATDKGITGDKIIITNISDVSGPVPGLFEDAQLATKAAVAQFNAEEGTLYGRKLELRSLDSRLDAGANRSRSIEACDTAFADVGSVSAFDQGGAPVVQECGIPGIRGLSTTDQMKAVPNSIPMNAAGKSGQRSLGSFGWAKAKFPDAVKSAAYIFIDGEVTRQQATQDAEAAEAVLGFDFKELLSVGITETNYGPVVQKLKSSKIRYVTFSGAYQQAASLAKTFKQQGFKPDVFQPVVTAYTPDFISQAGDAAEGVYVAVTPSLVEEIGSNPELQLYAKWLGQVAPGATPTAIGQFAWAAVRFFIAQMKLVGAKPTRKALLDRVNKVPSYNGNGLYPSQGIASRGLGDCTSVVVVKGGKFVRFEPTKSRGLRCGDGVYDTRSDRKIPAIPNK